MLQLDDPAGSGRRQALRRGEVGCVVLVEHQPIAGIEASGDEVGPVGNAIRAATVLGANLA